MSPTLYWARWYFPLAAQGCLPPGANVFVAAPTPAIRSPIVILMVTTMELVWTVNYTLSWGVKFQNSIFCPSRCRLHAHCTVPPGADAPHSPPPSCRHWCFLLASLMMMMLTMLIGEAATVCQSVLSDQDVGRRPPGGISALDQDMSRTGSTETPPLAPWQPVTSSFQLQQHVRADATVSHCPARLWNSSLLFCSHY